HMLALFFNLLIYNALLLLDILPMMIPWLLCKKSGWFSFSFLNISYTSVECSLLMRQNNE
ncbi:hypothetical protein, partial [Providencia rustigianii]